jgi:hypothetical protein
MPFGASALQQPSTSTHKLAFWTWKQVLQPAHRSIKCHNQQMSCQCVTYQIDQIDIILCRPRNVKRHLQDINWSMVGKGW